MPQTHPRPHTDGAITRRRGLILTLLLSLALHFFAATAIALALPTSPEPPTDPDPTLLANGNNVAHVVGDGDMGGGVSSQAVGGTLRLAVLGSGAAAAGGSGLADSGVGRVSGLQRRGWFKRMFRKIKSAASKAYGGIQSVQGKLGPVGKIGGMIVSQTPIGRAFNAAKAMVKTGITIGTGIARGESFKDVMNSAKSDMLDGALNVVPGGKSIGMASRAAKGVNSLRRVSKAIQTADRAYKKYEQGKNMYDKFQQGRKMYNSLRGRR